MNTVVQILSDELHRGNGKTDVRIDGVRFIHHIDRAAKFRFLHKLFPPISNSKLEEIQSNARYDFPQDYIDFLRFSNGAVFFDNAVYFYGFDDYLNRSLDIRDQRALFIEPYCEEFRLQFPHDFEDSWRVIGSIVARNRILILIDSNGSINLRFGMKNRMFDTLPFALECLFSICRSEFNFGPVPDGGSVEIERRLFELP